MSSVLDPLVLELRMSRETIAGQAERLGYVTAGRDAARAELDLLRAAYGPGGSNPMPEAPALTTDGPVPLLARLRALAPGTLVVLAIMVAVVLLAWPR